MSIIYLVFYYATEICLFLYVVTMLLGFVTVKTIVVSLSVATKALAVTSGKGNEDKTPPKKAAGHPLKMKLNATPRAFGGSTTYVITSQSA